MKNIYYFPTFFYFILFSSVLYGQEFIESPVVTNAQFIIEGEIVKSEGFYSKDSSIYTSNEIRISKVIRGKLNTSTVELITEGGQVGNDIMSSSHYTANFYKGLKGIFFCVPSGYKVSKSRGALILQVYDSNGSSFINYSNEPPPFAFGLDKDFRTQSSVYSYLAKHKNIMITTKDIETLRISLDNKSQTSIPSLNTNELSKEEQKKNMIKQLEGNKENRKYTVYDTIPDHWEREDSLLNELKK